MALTTTEHSINSIDNLLPWVDKYRPRHIESLMYQNEVKKVLLNTLRGMTNTQKTLLKLQMI